MEFRQQRVPPSFTGHVWEFDARHCHAGERVRVQDNTPHLTPPRHSHIAGKEVLQTLAIFAPRFSLTNS
jgi:hypothetical protein